MNLKILNNKKTNTIFIILTLLITGIYAGFLYNQTLPLSEGWYTYYAMCINEKGLIPYRDFEYLYSPIYIFLITIITRIFGYRIIVLRFMGIIMFSVIALGVYFIIRLIVGKENSWIACIAAVTSSFYMQSEVVQIFYDYVRLMDIVSVFSVFLLLKTIKKMSEKEKYDTCLLETGVMCALLINIKQNCGLIISVYTIALMIYLGLYYHSKAKEILKNIGIFILPIILINIVIYILLAVAGCLPYYFQSTGSGALSAKGGLFAILLGWIPNNWYAFKAGFPLAVKVLLILAIIIALNHFLEPAENNTSKFSGDSSVEKYWGILFGIITIIFLFLIRRSENFTESIFSANYLSPYTIFMIVFPIFICFGLWGIKNILVKERRMDNYILLFSLSGAYFAIAYSCGNSGGIAEGQSTLGIAFIITVFLLLFRYKWERLIRVLVILICFGLTLQTAEKKMIYTYNWWGLDESNFWSSCKPSNIPLIKGIGMSLETWDLYDKIYQIIMDNTTEDDSIFCFPQIPIFYCLSSRSDPGTRSKVQWFDVSTDDTLVQDIEVIRENKPKVIIMYNTSETAYQGHENAFRNGHISGTKKMREFLYNFVYENQYTFMGRFTANNNIIQVWAQKSADMEEISIFSGGNGTIESPYLIETPAHLITFAQMVNDGRTFEGLYIKQIADIDLSCVENWIPIGRFGSENAFYGTYDGAGHVIMNLHASQTEEDYNLGLFGQLGGRVYNLGLESGTITGACCGGITSHSIGSNAAIINCYSNIDITALRAGGIADNFTGTIRNCISTGQLQGIDSADILSYCMSNSCNADKVYVLDGTFTSLSYTASLHNPIVSYCSREYMKGAPIINALNEYVNIVNEQNSGNKETNLVKWTSGNDNRPVFMQE